MTRGITFQGAPLLLLLFFCARISAEQLPIKTYTIADGLARDTVTCIVHDSHGFMWFCTPDGLSRFDGYNGSARLPLVFVLHGMGGSGKSIEQTTGMSAKADQENFIVVYPNGVGHPIVWNAGLTDISHNGADDVGFIRAVMDKLEHDLRIDKNRIYCCGFSSGAIMSYLLGAKLSHRLAAIGIASGTVGNTASGSVRIIPDPSEPVPVIAFHGRQDHTIYYNGGGNFANLPVADSIAFWVKADGCALPPLETTRQQGDLKIDDYNICHDGSEVVLYSYKYGTQ